MAEHLHRPAARGIVIALKAPVVLAELLEHLKDVHVAAHDIGAAADLHEVVPHLVRLVPDVADELFEHVLHRDDAHRAAVIVGDDRQVQLFRLELGEQGGDPHRLVHEDAVGHEVGKAGVGLLHDRLEQVAHLQNADDVVDGAPVDGDAGEVRAEHHLERLVERVLDVDRDEVDARGQDLLHGDLVKVEGRLHEIALLLLEHALLLDRFDDVFELLLGNGGLRLRALQKAQGKLLDLDEEEDHGGQQLDEELEQAARLHGDRLAVLLRQRFRQDFSKDQYQDGHHRCGDRRARGAEDRRRDHRGNRRARHVDDVVAHQDGREQAVEVVHDRERPFRFFVSAVRVVLHADLVEGRIGRLTRGEKGGEAKQYHQNQV